MTGVKTPIVVVKHLRDHTALQSLSVALNIVNLVSIPQKRVSCFQIKYLTPTFNVDCGAETKDLILEDLKGCIRGCEEFKYLGVKVDKEDRQENYIKNRINKPPGSISHGVK